MKNLGEQIEKVMNGLDQSQDILEEMAYELLNAVDHVRMHNDELNQLVDMILEAESAEVTEESIQALKITVGKISRAMNELVQFVHKNEEASSEQRKYVEEAKQVVDFLRCSIDWDKLL